MRKRIWIISFIVSVVFLLLSTYGVFAQTYQYRWQINGNEHEGILEYNVVNHRITGKIYGNPIEGFQVGRHVVFHRESHNHQLWVGWISERSGKTGKMISGTFSNNGENSYPWEGIRVQ